MRSGLVLVADFSYSFILSLRDLNVCLTYTTSDSNSLSLTDLFLLFSIKVTSEFVVLNAILQLKFSVKKLLKY